ncbi:MAG: hypothetical protein ABEJ83_05350 [Candidatus Nanohaloarchaea archaeon]
MVTINMNRLSKAAVLATLVTALFAVSAAAPLSMNVFPEQSSARIDSFTSYELKLENTGTVKDIYYLSTSNVNEVRVAPDKVELQPQEEKTVNVWFNPAVDREEGTYSFKITAESRATGNRFSVTPSINVIKEHDVSLQVTNSRTACLGEKAYYTVKISNNGIQREKFRITTDYGKLSQNSVTLEDGETKEIQLQASSKLPTEKSFNVVAASPTSYAQEIENVRFTAEHCWDSEVVVTPKNKRVAAFNDASFKVTVRNKGTKDDTFTLSATKGEFEDSKLEVGSGESKTTTLTVTPETLGKRSIQVRAVGNSQSSQTVSVNVYNGMKMDVQASDRTVCEDASTTSQVEITNTGKADETFSVSATSGKLSASEVSVPEGRSETVDLKFSGAARKPGKYSSQVKVKAKTFGKPVVRENVEFTVENCWDLRMNVIPRVESAGDNRSTVYEVRLENTGTKKNTYKLDYEGPRWVSIEPGKVTVAPGETEKAFIYAGIPFRKKGEVEITAEAVGHDVKKSETMKLLINKEIEEAIKDEARRTGFDVPVEGNAAKIAASVLTGIVLAGAVLLFS